MPFFSAFATKCLALFVHRYLVSPTRRALCRGTVCSVHTSNHECRISVQNCKQSRSQVHSKGNFQVYVYLGTILSYFSYFRSWARAFATTASRSSCKEEAKTGSQFRFFTHFCLNSSPHLRFYTLFGSVRTQSWCNKILNSNFFEFPASAIVYFDFVNVKINHDVLKSKRKWTAKLLFRPTSHWYPEHLPD